MKIIYQPYFIVLLLFVSSCVKTEKMQDVASLRIFNATIGCDSLITNFTGAQPIKWYKGGQFLEYGKVTNSQHADINGMFNVIAGNQPLALFHYPDTSAKSKPIFDLSLQLPARSINTLFLTGTLTAPDMLLTADNPPYHPAADSTMGLRFVHLSPGNLKVSINLKGQASGSEMTTIGYKEISPFKKYPIVTGVNEYIYEFRDAENDNLLLTYKLDVRSTGGSVIKNLYRYLNYTMALYGDPASTGVDKLAVQIIGNHY